MSFTLRPHQERDLNALRHELRTHRAVLLAAECGYGKGVIVTKIIEGMMQRKLNVLFLVFGRDRVSDMDERVTKLGIPHGVLMGGQRRERWHPVQIASSSTVHRMQHKPKADLILVDECHLAMSPTFREVLDSYTCRIIGMTATPMLGNGRALGRASGGIFDAMVLGPSTKELIAGGHLVGSRVMAPPPPPEMAGLKKKKTGEFDDEQGASMCDTSKVIGDVVDHCERFGPDRKALSFGFTKKHAFDIAEAFRLKGYNWAYVDADTPDGDIHTPGTRKFFWHQYDHGDLVGISSCQTVSIGWDHSICKKILLCSKTASFPLYRQRLGRGSRTHKGFSDFLVMDHCANLYEHEERGAFFESDIEWQLDGDAVKVKDVDKARRVATCKVPVKISESGPALSFRGTIKDGYMLPCLNPYAPGPDTCPFCGIPIIARERSIEVEDGELKEFTPEMREAAEAKIRTESARKAEYLDLVRVAKEKNYRAGFPSIMFKNRHGFWPPKGWKQEVEMVVGS